MQVEKCKKEFIEMFVEEKSLLPDLLGCIHWSHSSHNDINILHCILQKKPLKCLLYDVQGIDSTVITHLTCRYVCWLVGMRPQLASNLCLLRSGKTHNNIIS